MSPFMHISSTTHMPAMAVHDSSGFLEEAPTPKLSLFFLARKCVVMPLSVLPRPLPCSLQNEVRLKHCTNQLNKWRMKQNTKLWLIIRKKVAQSIHFHKNNIPAHFAHHFQAEVVFLLLPETVAYSRGTGKTISAPTIFLLPRNRHENTEEHWTDRVRAQDSQGVGAFCKSTIFQTDSPCFHCHKWW